MLLEDVDDGERVKLLHCAGAVLDLDKDGNVLLADKDGGIHMSHRSLENKWSEACRAVDKNLPTGIHNIRYTFATRMYNELRAEGMSEKRAEKAVSESLFHHREEITRHYLK